MLAEISLGIALTSPLAQTASALSPAAILALCVVAGLGTALLLPSHLRPSLRKVGGALFLLAGITLLTLVVHHTPHGVYFWIFSAIALFGAARVVTHQRPVYSALYFVLTVFASAGLFVLLMADFMAAALVVIYAGAILVTYVFVIMLAVQAATPDSATAARHMADYDANSRDPFIASAIGFALMGVLLFVIFDKAEAVSPESQRPAMVSDIGAAPNVSGNTQQLAVYLFDNQQVSLELAGLLLTIAMVGAIIIARRRVLRAEPQPSAPAEAVVFPATPIDDNPYSIPVYGTDNPRQKAYPET